MMQLIHPNEVVKALRQFAQDNCQPQKWEVLLFLKTNLLVKKLLLSTIFLMDNLFSDFILRESKKQSIKLATGPVREAM